MADRDIVVSLPERITIPFSHSAVSADTTVKVPWKVPTGRKFRVDRVTYIEPATGLAADASNYYVLSIHDGSNNIAASWSTQTGQQGSIAANTVIEFVAGAAPVLDAGETLTLLLDLTGTANLPAGSGVIEGRYV